MSLLFILTVFQLVNLGMRTGVTGLALIVKGHIHDDFADTIVEFNGCSAFFLEVFNMQPVDVCSKFQQWVCSQKLSQYPHHLGSTIFILTCVLGRDMPDNLQTAQNDCATLIKKGLRECLITAASYLTNYSLSTGMITNIPNLGMNYLNYPIAIQQKHHVELLGWPQNIPFANPHHITVVAVARKLQHALSVATCKWVVMTTRRVKEHAEELALAVDGGDTVSRKRKQRSDKGTKRKRMVAVDEESEADEEVAPPAKKKSGTTKKRSSLSKAATSAKKSKANKTAKTARRIAGTLPPAAQKSKEFISSDEDESDA
jgi:hypothetical protein